MLTEEQLKKIQEAMEDTEFAKSVSETKTEEEIVSLLKDKKGITVSVDDIKDLVETVKQIPTEELNVSGGDGFFSDLLQGAKNAVGLGASGELGKALSGGNGVPQRIGACGTYAVAAAAALATVSVLGYKVYKKYCGKSGGESVATPTAASGTAEN